MTAAVCSTRLATGDKRSIRAVSTAWMVSGRASGGWVSLLLRHITGQFFKKEWIAIGFRHYLVQQRRGHLRGGEQGLHHLGTVVRCQP